MTGKIRLRMTEAKLAASLWPVNRSLSDPNTRNSSCDRGVAARLLESLLARKAVPEVRIRYIRVPIYNITTPRISRYRSFEKLLNDADLDVLDPETLGVLRYMVYGSDLPLPVRRSFQRTFNTTSGSRTQLQLLARRQYRAIAKNSKDRAYFAEAFYRLALDAGCSQWDARGIRDAVKVTRMLK